MAYHGGGKSRQCGGGVYVCVFCFVVVWGRVAWGVATDRAQHVREHKPRTLLRTHTRAHIGEPPLAFVEGRHIGARPAATASLLRAQPKETARRRVKHGVASSVWFGKEQNSLGALHLPTIP